MKTTARDVKRETRFERFAKWFVVAIMALSTYQMYDVNRLAAEAGAALVIFTLGMEWEKFLQRRRAKRFDNITRLHLNSD